MVATWSRSKIPRKGAYHSASQRPTRSPARKSQNSKSYEGTRQPIENKGQEVLRPNNLLKVDALASLSRQGIENEPFIPEERAVKNSNPVNLLKLNIVSSVHPSIHLAFKR